MILGIQIVIYPINFHVNGNNGFKRRTIFFIELFYDSWHMKSCVFVIHVYGWNMKGYIMRYIIIIVVNFVNIIAVKIWSVMRCINTITIHIG